ncbi:SASS6 family protein [Megaselia abdita]
MQEFESDFANGSPETIVQVREVSINLRMNGMSLKRAFLINAEKTGNPGLIQLRMTDKSDHSKMYVSTIDLGSFNELKQEQSLHVSFAGFVDNLVHLLEKSFKGEMFISLTSCSGNEFQNEGLTLQFFEVRPFKNLVHLSLPVKLASTSVVLFHVNSLVEKLKKSNQNYENTIQTLQYELNNNCSKIKKLEHENQSLRQDLVEQTNIATSRLREELSEVQDQLRRTSENKEMMEERFKQNIKSLQGKLEEISSEKMSLVEEKSRELKRLDHLKNELSATKSTVESLKEQNDKLRTEMGAMQNLDRQHEIHMSDSKRKLFELQESIRKFDKIKSELQAELEAEKKLCHTKRTALDMASKEIEKANEIIAKQRQEIKKLQQTTTLRTQIVLHQEQAMKAKEIELNHKIKEIDVLRKMVENFRNEIPIQLHSMKVLADGLENKYGAKIKELTLRLNDGSNKENVARNRR